MLSQTMNKLMDVGETMGAGKHSVELYVKLVDVVRNVGCALVATTFRHDHHDQHSLLFFHCSFVVVSIRLVFIGVHWCSLPWFIPSQVKVGTARMSSTSGEINVVGLVKAQKLVEIETASGPVSTRNNNGHTTEKVRRKHIE